MKLYISLLLCLFVLNVTASQKGVTEVGDIVILNDDGTWVYEDASVASEEIALNPTTYKTPSNSTFILKSKKNNANFAINSKEWIFEKSTRGDTAIEYNLSLKAGDLYAIAITERVQVDLDKLVEIALHNAKLVAPDTKVLKKEYRIVNNNKVIYMEMIGTMQGIKFKYLGYYFSDASGSTQYVAFTGENLVEKYKQEIENILNGLSVRQ